MKCLLALLIIVYSGCAYSENWLPLGENTDGKSVGAIDYDSLNLSPSRPTFWIKVGLKTPRKDSFFGPAYVTLLTRWEIECRSGNIRAIAQTKLSESGVIVGSEGADQYPITIPPGDALENIKNFLCYLKENGLAPPGLVMTDQWEELKSARSDSKLYWSERSTLYRGGLLITKEKIEFISQPTEIKVQVSNAVAIDVIDCKTATRASLIQVFFDKQEKISLTDLDAPRNFQPFLSAENREYFSKVCAAFAFKEDFGKRKAEVDKGPPEAAKPKADKAFGSGFFINADGYIATNHHVINGCRSLSVRLPNKDVSNASVVVFDAINDLAIIKSNIPNRSYASLRGIPGRSGEGIIAIGFPYTGLLASEANVATGNVSATAGLGNDYTKLQISAPIQPGNSGGPLLDGGGAVVGIVVSKLNAIAVFKLTGDIPQNINFAIKSDMLKLLLDSNQIKYSLAPLGKKMETQDVAEKAKQFTVLIECN